MAVPTNTSQTYAAKNIREDLSDVVDRISPTETPFLQMIGRGTAKSTFHEWMTVDLSAAVDTNARVEGDDATAGTVNQAVRLGNYTQISDKTVIVSGTNDAVDGAGDVQTLAEQVAMKTLELRLDIEKTVLSNKAASAGNASTARTAASFASFLQTNVSRGSSGANPTLSGTTNGYPNAAATDGTQRSISEALLKSVIASCWSNGANPKYVLCGATQKQAISAFTGNATRYKEAEDKKLIAAIDVYVSDFGQLQIVPSRLMRSREVFVIDPSKASLDYLRNVKQNSLAKTGDAEKRQIIGEWTLKVHNEKAHGIVADLS